MHLKLIKDLKDECKNKGYSPPTNTLNYVTVNAILHNNSVMAQKRKKRTSESHLLTFTDFVDNHTVERTPMLENMETMDNEYIDMDEEFGTFHEPTVLNKTLEAMCGSLSIT
jgi:hypothetical protein